MKFSGLLFSALVLGSVLTIAGYAEHTAVPHKRSIQPHSQAAARNAAASHPNSASAKAAAATRPDAAKANAADTHSENQRSSLPSKETPSDGNSGLTNEVERDLKTW